MDKRIVPIIVCWLILMGCQHQNDRPLLIATSGNMQFATNELIRAFVEESGVPCEAVIGSSGKLSAQIKEGAPFDVFLSADMMYPNDLFNAGFGSTAPQVYAYGRLILWSMGLDISSGMNSISFDSVDYVAVANPKTAPYGRAAEEALIFYGLNDRLKEKLVYGESISQTNQFIISGAADLGFTVQSVVKSSVMAGKGYWFEIDPLAYSPISQGMVILKNEPARLLKAQQFSDFVLSEKGQKILQDFGYAVM